MKNCKSVLINKLLELYSTVFTITELAGGLQFAMKCKECNRSTEMKPRKLYIYKEVPWAVCSFCFGAKVKTFPLIKKASKGVFNIKSSKNEFLSKNGVVTLECIENGHITETVSPLKFCQQCYDNKDHFYIKKTVKKNTTTNDYYQKKDEFILKIKSLSQKNVLESLKSLFIENSKKFVINLGAFKRFNIRKVLCTLKVNYVEQEETLTFSTIDESSKGNAIPKDEQTVVDNVNSPQNKEFQNDVDGKFSDEFIKQEIKNNYQKHLKSPEESINVESPQNIIVENYSEKLQELMSEKSLQDMMEELSEESSCIPQIIEHPDDNFEYEEEASIQSQPINNVDNIDVEINYCDHTALFDKHDKFMEEYYRDLNHHGPVINEEKRKDEYVLFKKACDEKYYEFDPVMYNAICRSNNNVCHKKTKKYVNHLFNDFKASFKTGFFDNFENNLVYTPSPIFSIIDRRMTDTYLLDKSDLDVKKLEMAEIMDTPEDVRHVQKVVETIRNVKKEVTLFQSHGADRKSRLMQFLTTLKYLYEADFTLTDIALRELLVSEYSQENDNFKMLIDPVGVVTIILCLMNNQASPYYVYFSKSKNIVHDKENRVYLQRGNGHVLLSKRAANKILYIDSGVAALFWKIVFCQTSLEKYNVEKYSPSKLLEFCPDALFDISDKNIAGVSCKNVNIVGYLDFSYDFAEFLTMLLEETTPGYEQRALMCRAIMMMSEKCVKYHTKLSVRDFLSEHMRVNSKFCILNEEEKETLSTYNASLAEILINSEIKNIFGKQILTAENTQGLGTILYPKCTIYSKDEELPKDFLRKNI